MATPIGWHAVEAVPAAAREVVCDGDEYRTIRGRRHYYVERCRSGWWLYCEELHPHTATPAVPQSEVRCRELDAAAPQGTDDARWIAAYSA